MNLMKFRKNEITITIFFSVMSKTKQIKLKQVKFSIKSEGQVGLKFQLIEMSACMHLIELKT